MANLTDADKVIRNDVGKTIASKLDDIADAIVQQGGGAHSLGQLSDVDIDTTTLAEGQSIVYNPTTQKFENGEVSTVAALDDLTDVSITSAQKGDSLRNDGNGNWVNEPTTITMTLAEWNAMSTAEQTAWINSHKNTRLIISDAPNLEYTSKQISYDGGTDTVWDKVESVKNSKIIAQALVSDTALTTTATDYNTVSNRKFSDYDLLVFKLGNSLTDIRRTVVLPSSIWSSGWTINEGVLHGSTASTPTSYQYSSFSIIYKSDTSITASVSGSGTIAHLAIYGLKITQ